MRIGRSKATRRTLQYYHRHAQLLGGGGNEHSNNNNYRILVDGTFLVTAARYKFLQDELRKRLTRLLQCRSVHLAVTRASLQELQQLAETHKSNDTKAMLREARQYGLDESDEIVETKASPNHESDEKDARNDESPRKESKRKRKQVDRQDETDSPSLSTAAQTVVDHISATKSNEYLVATQDDELAQYLRKHFSQVPLIRILVPAGLVWLEPPSFGLQRHVENGERTKRMEGGKRRKTEEAQVIAQAAAAAAAAAEAEKKKKQPPVNEYERRKRSRKAKGPNPLSCKRKSKTKTTKTQTKSVAKEVGEKA